MLGEKHTSSEKGEDPRPFLKSWSWFLSSKCSKDAAGFSSPSVLDLCAYGDFRCFMTLTESC